MSLNVVPEQPKHHVKLKDVKHLILELPIPADLLGNILRKDLKEFTHVKYTACTSEPDNFVKKGFTLRQAETSPPRPIELLIMLTMYNEDKDLLSCTFHGVVKNIAHLCTRKRSKIWGEDGWKKVVVCIVADGRENIEKSSLAYLAALGVYQDGVTVEKVKDDVVNAHIFEYTTQISIDHSMNIKTGEDSEVVPIQVLFCLKEKEAKKINSYQWFFNAFGTVLQPNICVLIDVGTEPGPKSIYNLWKAFNVDPSVAGACGEIVVKKGKGRIKLLYPIVAAQNFEYKMINILDKPFESVFGYITTLPEAFSAYRYIALQNITNDKGEVEGPLTSYFKSEINNVKKRRSIFAANMYHARGHILSLELVTKRGCSWLLHYVKSSKAEINVPEEVCGLINQRIRWLSGSLFANFYAITHFYYIWRSGHSFGRKLFLLIEMVFQAYKFVFSWFSLGNFYLIFYILGSVFSNLEEIAIPAPWSHYVIMNIFMVLQYAFPGLIIVQLILALMYYRSQCSQPIRILTMLFGLIMVYMLLSAFWLSINEIMNLYRINSNDSIISFLDDHIFRDITLSLVSTYGLYLIASFIMFDPWHMFTCILQYTFLIPFYVIILNIYSFCNLHQASWIRREIGDEEEKLEKTISMGTPRDVNSIYRDAIRALRQPSFRERSITQDKYENLQRDSRSIMIMLFWLFSNAALVAVIIIFGNELIKNIYIAVILWSIAGFAALKILGTLTYLIFRLFTDPNILNCK
ncbi:glycosyltransferase family 2 protein [Gigaspora rosea]|uniref:Chitin synthase n=1 Tax=Gigaspora rosea TaxID=44941 RepID=A0A397UVJ5_9GLOM|nr:glycosyltransferase family 2 protein [Gigaspora rosea]